MLVTTLVGGRVNMNARTLLIGIGIVAVVTGGVLGSGALTQVNAERTATVTTVDDSAAAISLSPAPNLDGTIDATSTGADGELELAFANINPNATTTTAAFEITNTLTEGVEIQVSSSETWLTVENVSSNKNLAQDDSVIVEFEIDTTDGSGFNSGDSVTITVDADTETYTAP